MATNVPVSGESDKDEAGAAVRHGRKAVAMIRKIKTWLTALIFREISLSARREVHGLNARLASIVESSQDAIISKTLDGVILSWNPGATNLFGYTAEEAIHQSIRMLIPADRQEEESHILGRLSRGERIKHYETVRLAKDGRTIDVSLTISPLRDAGGRVVGASTIVRDITERRQAMDQLAELHRKEKAARRAAEVANRAKDEFLAILGHELRNPLAPIATALELMRMRGDKTTQAEQEVIKHQVQHMVRLVDDLLDVSRITSGKIVLYRQPIELAEVVQRAIEMSSPMLEEREQDLLIDVPASGLMVHVDPARMAQVLTNLLTNAAKFTGHRGRVTITAARESSGVLVRVADTGSGIPAEALPQIFDLFVQEEQSAARQKGGLGLGLAIVRSLTEMHGGSVQVHSDGPGKGSEFTIRLPLHATTAAAVDGAQPRVSFGTRKQQRILLVDDNTTWTRMLEMALTQHGHIVRAAHDGPAGLQAASEFQPESIILDLGLPLMDGFEVARQLRATERFRNIRIIAISGYGQPHDRERSLAAGFDAHLAKPVSLEEIQALL